MLSVSRHTENPILAPVRQRPWESVATFNPSAAKAGGETLLFYRAMARPDALITPYAGRSTIGLATSRGGGDFEDRRQVIVPSEPRARYGCEDPRATFFEGRWYVFYTALAGYPYAAEKVKIAVAIGEAPDRLSEKHLVTAFNAKAAALFPERIDGKVAMILSVHTDSPPASIAVALADRVEDFWEPSFWERWHAELSAHTIAGLVRGEHDFAEVGAVPVRTEEGWLLVYANIQNHSGGGDRTFGVEAAILDAGDPRKVLAATAFPFLVPEETYERYGTVPDIVFPTGLLLDGDVATVYYGAADTVCASAKLRLSHLLSTMGAEKREAFARRVPGEAPLLSPLPEHAWESKAVLNPAALDTGDAVHIVYRAMGADSTSVLGYARLAADGLTLEERLPEPIYIPRADFESKRGAADANSGCEDPRLSAIDGVVHLCYTAYDSVEAPRGAHASIPLEDFLARRFNRWSAPALLTPHGVADKDVCIFPEKLGGKFVLVHRVDPTICTEELDALPPQSPIGRCVELAGPRRGMWDSVKLGAAGPPIRIPEGWLFVYHAVGPDHAYRLGAMLLDGETGQTVLARTDAPILEPVLPWERRGVVGNVVFACGAAVRGDDLILYYGGADSAIGAAVVSLSELVSRLLPKV